jgi:hypothetical protein
MRHARSASLSTISYGSAAWLPGEPLDDPTEEAMIDADWVHRKRRVWKHRGQLGPFPLEIINGWSAVQ